MADTDDLDDSIHFTRAVPALWHALDVRPNDYEITEIDKANQLLMEAITQLEEAPKLDENSAMHADIARLDAKLDLLMNMLSRVLAQFHDAPDTQTLTMSAHYIAWHEAEQMPQDEFGKLELFIHPTIATPLIVPLHIEGSGRGAIFGFGSKVQNSWEKYLFRQHRREIAQSKNAE